MQATQVSLDLPAVSSPVVPLSTVLTLLHHVLVHCLHLEVAGGPAAVFCHFTRFCLFVLILVISRFPFFGLVFCVPPPPAIWLFIVP